jgi:hypothetical protein
VALPASRSISEETLGGLLENISPARSFLIIDACHSGKALDTDGAAVGPMNSTGLAQLAYEKGLYILAASQGIESALEAPQLAGGHGYFTYALVEEGLKTNDAAQNGVVEIRPWFEYASRRVPDLQTALRNGATLTGRGMKRPGEAGASGSQHPRMFYRREPEVSPFIVAKPPTNPYITGASQTVGYETTSDEKGRLALVIRPWFRFVCSTDAQ